MGRRRFWMRTAPILAGAFAGTGVFLYRWNTLSGKGGTSMDDAWETVFLAGAVALAIIALGEVLISALLRRGNRL